MKGQKKRVETAFNREEIQLEARRLEKKLGRVGYSLSDCALIAPETLAIRKLKEKNNAIVLAHNYQRPEILFGIADVTGDSLELAKTAKTSNARVIVLCGVRFMAETAKVLNPEKIVLLPEKKAGCSLAESIKAEDVREIKKKHPGIPVVCYVNTGADVKAESDVCCTSSNAARIIRAMPGESVIFIPDVLMAKNLAKQTGKNIISWEGKCIVHDAFTPQQVAEFRKIHPKLRVLAHTECLPSVVALADYAGGTTGMIKYIEDSGSDEFLVVTECGMNDLLREKFPEKKFLTPCTLCPYMKSITLENARKSLETMQERIEIPEETAERARKSLEKMLELSA